MRIMESLCSKFLLRKEKGWKATTSPGLSTDQQMDHEKLKCLPANSPSYRPTVRMYTVHQSRCPLGVQQYTHQGR